MHPETHTRQQAERFHELHQGPELLVLPNAWDVASACLFAGLNGCRAIATTSAGIAAGLGYLDGEQIRRDEMLDAVARIVAAVPVPVNADLESGYGPSAADTADTVDAAIEVGVGGINLEDGDQGAPDRLVDTQDHVAKIVAAREVAESRGVPVVLNARTDVYWRSSESPMNASTTQLSDCVPTERPARTACLSLASWSRMRSAASSGAWTVR